MEPFYAPNRGKFRQILILAARRAGGGDLNHQV